MKKIMVMSRRKAVDYTYNEMSKDSQTYAIVSISDLQDGPPSFHRNDNLFSVLNLYFDDVDKTEKGCYAMSNRDAEKVAEFVSKVKDKIDVLIVHCLAGRSRSAGMAAALSKYYFGTDEEYFKYYNPNMLVYRKTLEALNKSEE